MIRSTPECAGGFVVAMAGLASSMDCVPISPHMWQRMRPNPSLRRKSSQKLDFYVSISRASSALKVTLQFVSWSARPSRNQSVPVKNADNLLGCGIRGRSVHLEVKSAEYERSHIYRKEMSLIHRVCTHCVRQIASQIPPLDWLSSEWCNSDYCSVNATQFVADNLTIEFLQRSS